MKSRKRSKIYLLIWISVKRRVISSTTKYKPVSLKIKEQMKEQVDKDLRSKDRSLKLYRKKNHKLRY